MTILRTNNAQELGCLLRLVSAGVQLQSKDYELAMKFCKFANSALQYEDANTAIQNLSKALNLLTTGQP